MDLHLLVSESICFFILVSDDRGYLVCTLSSDASPYIIFGSSMNLHRGCSGAFELPYVWGQAIYVVLVNCLMGSGPAALNTCHIDVILPFQCCYAKVIFAGMPPYV